MSSDDSGFDKEAEREKLREKYERDEEGRENTRRMSELLLQGATMTGKHCNQCGDPIFRYDGQEFCPTCQQEAEGDGSRVDEATDQSSAGAASGGADSAESTADRGEESDDDGRATAADAATEDEPRVEVDGISVADRHVDRSDVRRPPSQQDDRSGRARDHTHERAHSRDGHASGRDARTRDPGDDRSGGRPRGRDGRAGGSGAGASDLDAARDALVRTLTDLSRRAEEADDAARARELLAAAREAAEALAALDRANR